MEVEMGLSLPLLSLVLTLREHQGWIVNVLLQQYGLERSIVSCRYIYIHPTESQIGQLHMCGLQCRRRREDVGPKVHEECRHLQPQPHHQCL